MPSTYMIVQLEPIGGHDSCVIGRLVDTATMRMRRASLVARPLLALLAAHASSAGASPRARARTPVAIGDKPPRLRLAEQLAYELGASRFGADASSASPPHYPQPPRSMMPPPGSMMPRAAVRPTPTDNRGYGPPPTTYNARHFGQPPMATSIVDAAATVSSRFTLCAMDMMALLTLAAGRAVLLVSLAFHLALTAVRRACALVGLVLSSPFWLVASSLDRLGCFLCAHAERTLATPLDVAPQRPLPPPLPREPPLRRFEPSWSATPAAAAPLPRPAAAMAPPAARYDLDEPVNVDEYGAGESPELEAEVAARLAREQMLARSRQALTGIPQGKPRSAAATSSPERRFLSIEPTAAPPSPPPLSWLEQAKAAALDQTRLFDKQEEAAPQQQQSSYFRMPGDRGLDDAAALVRTSDKLGTAGTTGAADAADATPPGESEEERAREAVAVKRRAAAESSWLPRSSQKRQFNRGGGDSAAPDAGSAAPGASKWLPRRPPPS